MENLLGPLRVLFLIFLSGYRSAESTRRVTQNDLPEGYSIFPYDNVAYKIYTDRVTWQQARARCILDGGDLAIVDTLEKQVHLTNGIYYSHPEYNLAVGIHKPIGSEEWIRVDNGLPVTLTLWNHYLEVDIHNCSEITVHRRRLSTSNCEWKRQSVCEIPMNQFHANSTFAPNNGESIGRMQALPSDSLPEGYSVFPGDNVAYKIYQDRMTWDEALARCVSDGGHLAIADTSNQIDRLKSIISLIGVYWYVGIYKPLGSQNWIRVDNDEPVRSTVSGAMREFATKGRICTSIGATGVPWATECGWRQPSVCQIDIVTEDSVATKRALPTSFPPEGYTMISGENVAYKINKNRMRWDEARDRCIADGGDLAIADTYDKIQRIKGIGLDVGVSLLVGFRKRDESQEWIRADNGQPMKSMPWGNRLTYEGTSCAVITNNTIGLLDRSCIFPMQSICEISMIPNDVATNDTAAEEVDAATQATSSTLLREGYSILSDENVAYKLYKDQVTWDEAHARCIFDGGDLATNETIAKILSMESTDFGLQNWSTVEIHSPDITKEIFIPPIPKPGDIIVCYTLPEDVNRQRNIDYRRRLSICEIPINEIHSDIDNNNASEDDGSVNATIILPRGHFIIHDKNVTYKIYKDRVSWDEARIRCIADGGDLAIADTVEKIQRIRSIDAGQKDWLSVGIYKPYGDKPWKKVNGSEILAPRIWGEFPQMDRSGCAVIPLNGIRLWNVDCGWRQQSVCEIPSGNYSAAENTLTSVDGEKSAERDNRRFDYYPDSMFFRYVYPPMTPSSNTDSESLNATTQAPASIIIPEGYSIFPDDMVAYKIYKKQISWDKAHDRCVADGGHLAVADTPVKIQHIKSIDSGVKDWLSVGIYKPFGYREWMRVDNGLPVTSMPWRSFPVFYGRACTVIPLHGIRLYNVKCEWRQASVCEISIGKDYFFPSNTTTYDNDV